MTNRFACKISLLSASFMAVALPGAATAAPPAAPSDDSAAILEPNETADQVYSYGVRRRNAADVGSAVTIMTADEIEARQYSFTADAVRETPGVALARNGSYGGFASIRIRGGSSGQTLVVVDGIVVNDPSAPQGGFNFANLDVADIEQIEVLRGPQSLIWGADAIGGVVSIRTRTSGPAVSAYAEGGSRGLARGGAGFFRGDEDAFLRATISGVRSDGVSRAASGSEADSYRSVAASLTGGVDLTTDADLRVFARFSDSKADIDGFPPPLFQFADTAETEDTRDYALAARLEHAAGDRYEGALSVSFNAIDRTNADSGIETFAADGDRFSVNYWGSAELSDAIRLDAGAEYERTAAKVSGVDERASAGALFAMLEARPTPRLILTAGARRDEFSNFDGATTSRIAGVYILKQGRGDATRLRASWGQGFRAPTLFELNFSQFGVIPNPNLHPERANGFDVGLEQEWSALRTIMRAAYFRQRVKDQIDFDFAGNGYFNIDRVKSEGVEVEAETDIGESAAIRLTYSFIDAVDANTGAAILRTPKHSGSASVFLSPIDKLQLSATAFFNGREDDFPAPNDSFVKLDIRAAYALFRTLEIYGRIENATDSDYEDVSGFGEPGRSVYAGLRVRL